MEIDFALFETRLRAAVGQEPLYAWALRVGISKGTLNSLLSRKALPKATLLMQMANNLDCSVDFLLGRSDLRAPAGPQHASQAALAEAIQAINLAHAKVEALSQQNTMSPQEQQIVAAFRMAGPERRQVFLDLARVGKSPKVA